MRRSRNVGVALIGLLVVAAISMAAASGRKPAREESAKTSVRVLADVEANQLGRRFPGLWARSQVTGELLGRLFPNTAFYKALNHNGTPPVPYLIAVSNGNLLMMPAGFNRLLRDYGIAVNDKNIVDLAKAFVILATGNEPITNQETGDPGGLDSFPPVSFLEAKRIRQVISGISYDAWLKVRIGEQTEEWYFASWYGQFGVVSRGTEAGKLIKQYDLPDAGPRQLRGQLDLTPSIAIDTESPSRAYVEWQDTAPHYYLIVDTNYGATEDSVRFILSGFPQNATNVYVRVSDTVRNTVRLLDAVQIDGQGDGTYFWKPPVESTGICKVRADTLDSLGVYHNATGPRKELTLEKTFNLKPA